LPAAPQKKPGPKPAQAKNAQPKTEKAKKADIKAAEEALHRARMNYAYGLGTATALLAVLAAIPGQSVWLDLHGALWGLAGAALPLWLLFSFYCCGLWLRNRSLLEAWLTLLAQALLLLFLSATIFIIARPAEALTGPFWPLASSCFERMGERWTAPELLGNGGLPGSLLGAGLALGCGKPGALAITLLLALACLPMALPPLQRSLVAKAAGRWGADAPPRPEQEKPERVRPERTRFERERPLREEPMDELEELDRIGREHGLRNPFRRKSVEVPTEDARIPTVANIEPLPPEEAPQPPKRYKKQPGEDAVKAAMENLLQNAAESGAKPQQGYKPPTPELLSRPGQGVLPERGEEEEIAYRLVKTLANFGVAVELVGRSRGPAVTRYELRPAEGVKISKITSLADDIALRLAATKVRIEAPIPGKPAVGVEIPNKKRAIVTLRELVESDTYRLSANKSKLTVALGKDIVGDLVCADLARLPHLLIAGTTGSGKSVCMNTLILSLMYNASPEDVKMVMVDPKQVEFNVYSGIPHLLVPVVSDPIKAAGALGWAVNAMEKRYTTISEQNVRDIDSYNNIAAMQDDLEHLPRIVIFIDELSDLMMVAPSDVEDSIQRLSQKGRAAGIHLVVSTQRPSVDVITGVIKSNLPGRIALSVASQIDSRTIINSMGAEQLLGNGDMLFSMNGGNNAIRVQGCFVSDAEVRKVVAFVKEKDPSREGYDDGVWEEIDRFAAQAARGKKRGGGFDLSVGDDGDEDDDPMLDAAIEVVVNAQLASTTMLQKKLKLGYARASRVVDLLEARGIVGPSDGAKPRKVLMSHAQWQEYMASGGKANAGPMEKRSFGGEEE